MKKIGKFFAGLGIGVGLGMLFAPKKGSELRKDLKVKLDELLANAKELDVDDVKELIETRVDEIKLELENFDKEKVLKNAQKKSKEIIAKADDLVKLAVKKGTPVLQKLTEEVKEKAVVFLEEAVNKLKEEKK